MSGAFSIPQRIDRLYPTRGYRIYARWKLLFDPIYAPVLDTLKSSSHPVLDAGCGLGLLAFYLRSHGFENEITGVDLDEAKVAAAQQSGRRWSGLTFRVSDARSAVGTFRGNFVLLDILHYLTPEAQNDMLETVAERVPPGGVVVIRDCLNDGGIRFRLTEWEEKFAGAVHWLKFERLAFPTAEGISAPFVKRGFSSHIERKAGFLPFNNYILIFRRPQMNLEDSGTTNA